MARKPIPEDTLPLSCKTSRRKFTFPHLRVGTAGERGAASLGGSPAEVRRAGACARRPSLRSGQPWLGLHRDQHSGLCGRGGKTPPDPLLPVLDDWSPERTPPWAQAQPTPLPSREGFSPSASGQVGGGLRNLRPTPPTHLGQSSRGSRRGTEAVGAEQRQPGGNRAPKTFQFARESLRSRPSGSDTRAPLRGAGSASRGLRFRDPSPAPRRTPCGRDPATPAAAAGQDTLRSSEGAGGAGAAGSRETAPGSW